MPEIFDPKIGLCSRCVHARVIPHPRGGGAYWRCALAEVDARFPRYPRLPVVACDGFEPGDAPEGLNRAS